MQNFFEKTFKLSERKTTVKTEILAGLTTFFAMSYIVIVNPASMLGGTEGMFGAIGQGVWNAIFVGGILACVIATLLMAFVANMPFALAAGMGLNSFFFVTFILPAVITKADPEVFLSNYGAGLAVIFISGILFLILSFTGLRSKIAIALPNCLKKAVPAGIGLFIAFIGLKSAGFVQANQFTFVALGDLTTWATAAPILAAFIGLIIIAVLGKKGVKANIIIGILVSTILYYIFSGTTPSWGQVSISEAFSDFGKYGVMNLNFGAAFGGAFGSVINVILVMMAFLLVDMFDTLGTLYGTATEANMLDENGDPINLGKCMMADSIGTTVGAVLGTSTVTTYVESSAGVAEGGKTGLTSLVVSICFLLCLFLSPIATVIPGVATAPALIYVGVLMLKNFAAVDMTDLRNAVPAFLTLIMMPLTYSISNGIGIGAISYVIITLCSGEFKKKDIIVTIIAVLFVLKFVTIGA